MVLANLSGSAAFNSRELNEEKIISNVTQSREVRVFIRIVLNSLVTNASNCNSSLYIEK